MNLFVLYRDSDARTVTETYVGTPETTDSDLVTLQGLLSAVCDAHPAKLSREVESFPDDAGIGSIGTFGGYTDVMELVFSDDEDHLRSVYVRGPDGTRFDEDGRVIASEAITALCAWFIAHVTVGGSPLVAWVDGRHLVALSAAEELISASQVVDPASEPICEWYKEDGMDLVSRGD